MAEKTFAPAHLMSVGEVNINNEHDRIQGTETIILSNYDERAKERGKIRMRAYETMILEL